MELKQTRNRWKPQLPPEVITELQTLKETKSKAELVGYLVALRDKGWSLRPLSQAIDVSREYVRQLTDIDPIGKAVMNLNSYQYYLPDLPTKPVIEKEN